MEIGVAYYPEQSPQKRWDRDIDLMRDAGISVVRMGEHTWSLVEPEPGVFAFDWLAEAIDKVHNRGLKVVLGTPTACPPNWLYREIPDLHLIRADGSRVYHGSRHTYCPNHPGLEFYWRRIVDQFAQRFAAHQAVVGWQIDNELSCSDSHLCYCDRCEKLFQRWLRKRYGGDLAAINRELGTSFWSQTYSAWDEIPIPRVTLHPVNPSLQLEFYRFASVQLAGFVRQQAKIIRSYNPSAVITHNLIGLSNRFDYRDLVKELDVVGTDIYPSCGKDPDPAADSLMHDVINGLGSGRHWVLEMQAMSGLNARRSAQTSRPGEMRLWAYQSFAHGADKVFYFNWRTCRFGGETYWQGILGHDGKINRFYRELKQICAETRAIREWLAEQNGQVLGAGPREVGFLYSYDSILALRSQLTLHPHFGYDSVVLDLYRAFYELNVPVTFVGPGADLSRFKIIVAPMLYVLDDSLVADLETFAVNGGTVLLTFRSGVVNPRNVATDLTLPGKLQRITGVEIEEYDPLPPDKSNRLEPVDTSRILPCGSAVAHLWCDVIRPVAARAEAVYGDDYFAGQAALTCNSYGQGSVWYLGTMPESEWLIGFVRRLVTDLGIPVIETPSGVEAVRWQTGKGNLLFLLNHNAQAVTMDLVGDCRDVLSGEDLEDGVMEVPAKGVLLLKGNVAIPDNDGATSTA